jgi:hypothetical protein
MTQKIVEMTRRPEMDWQHASGATMFVFELTLDDGQTGVANARSESPWYNVGVEVVAKTTGQTDGMNRFKIDKPEYENAPPKAMQPNNQFLTTKSDTDASIVASWAIDHAMKWPAANKSIDAIRETAKQLMELQHELKVHHKSKFPS